MNDLMFPPDEEPPKQSIVAVNAGQVATGYRIARFRGRPMVLVNEPFPHFRPLHREMFDKIAYPILGGVSRSRMSDVFAYLGNTAEDLTENDHLIAFGDPTIPEDGSAPPRIMVWNSAELEWEHEALYSLAVWRSPYSPLLADVAMDEVAGGKERRRLPFIMSLAGNDVGIYDDIMQSIAPLVMGRKPDGVIWWVGDGANGKSTLMDALWRIFPGQLSSITVKRLVDGRDTPSLNGTLANVVKESSEGRVEDTEIYKAIGTHENFRVHRFHSQDDLEVRGNVHHIFSANSVPTFNDKGWSARRRTFIIPFNQRFESDPTFEEKTFTPRFFGELVREVCYYAGRIKRQGYKYKWSAVTLAAKAEYDADANNAEEYAKHIISEGVVAFDSFNPLRIDYDNWCADNGYVPLGITNLRRAMSSLGFERISQRLDNKSLKVYRLPNTGAELQMLGMGRPGLYSTPGFIPEPAPEEKAAVPAFHEPRERDDKPAPPKEEPEKPKSILKGNW